MKILSRFQAFGSALVVVIALALGIGVVFAERSAAGHIDESLLRSPIVAGLEAEDFPGQSAVIVLKRKEHTYDFSKSRIVKDKVVKLLTKEGIERFGNFVSAPYHEKEDQYRLVVEVISPDGEKRRIGGSDKKKVKLYKSLYEDRVAIPGLEVGDIVYIHEEMAFYDYYVYGDWSFSDEVPVILSEFVLKIPSGVDVDFYFTPKDRGYKPEPVKEDVYDVYTIKMDNLPACKEEAYMAERDKYDPLLDYCVWEVNYYDIVSFFGIDGYERAYAMAWLKEQDIPFATYRSSWEEVAKVFSEYFETESWANEDRASEYREAAEQFLSEAKPDRIVDFVKDIDRFKRRFHERFRSIGYGWGTRLSNPEAIFVDKVGSTYSLAYAMKYFLEKIGITAVPILVRDADTGMLDRRVPTFFYDSILLLVETSTDQYWIDPGCPECGVNQLPWERQGVRGFPVRDKLPRPFAITPMKGDEANRLVVREKIILDESGRMSGVSRVLLVGQFLVELRRMAGLNRLSDATGRIEEYLEKWLGHYMADGAITIVSESRDSLELTYAYTLEAGAEKTGDYMRCDLRRWAYLPMRDAFEYEKRRYDIVVPFLYRMVSKVEISLPEGCMPAELPGTEYLASDCFEFMRTCYMEGDKLVYTRKIVVKNPEVTTRQYTEEKKLIDAIVRSDRVPAVFKMTDR